MASEKQIAANRRNARKSTGPRTPEGKRRVSQNALRHGLRSRMTEIAGDAEKARYYATSTLLQEDLQPASPEEAEVVLELARCVWMFHQLKEWEKEAYQAYETETTCYQAFAKRRLPWRLFYRYKTAVFNSFVNNVEEFLILRGMLSRPTPRAQKTSDRQPSPCRTNPMRVQRLGEIPGPLSSEEPDWMPSRARQDASLQQMFRVFEQLQALREGASQQSQSSLPPFPAEGPLKAQGWGALPMLFENTFPTRRSSCAMSNLIQLHSMQPSEPAPPESTRVMDAWREASQGVLFSSPVLPREEARAYEVLKLTVADQLRPKGSLEFCMLDWMLEALWNRRRLVGVEKEFYTVQQQAPKGQKPRGTYYAFYGPAEGPQVFTRLYWAKDKTQRTFYQAFNAWSHLAQRRELK